MSHCIEHLETTKWYVAHNNLDIFHVGTVEPQNHLTTGQPYLEIFDCQEDLLSAFPQLSGYFIEPEFELPLEPEPI